MKTSAKNQIVALIESINSNKGEYSSYKIEDMRNNREKDGSLNWGFSVFQTEPNKNGGITYRDLISDPTDLFIIAKALGAGYYVSVDTIGRKPEDWENAKRSTYGKPYIRLY
jgi:hypothetical protein